MCPLWPLPEGWLSMLLLQREQDTIPSRAVSQSVIWESGGIVGDCQAPIPHAGCRCGGGQAHAPGTEELCVCGVGVHVPGEAWTHHISLELLLYTHTMSGSHGATHTHTHTHTQTHKRPGSSFSLSTCLCGQHTDQEWLGPLARRINAVSARDIILAKRWRVSTQATDAPTPNASYIQPSVSVRACSINRWISACF